MSRNISNRVSLVEPPKVEREAKSDYREVTYSIKLITPMYGGGVTAGVNDQKRPVRVTSVRGNLRFWWRATRGTAFNSLKDLRKKESEIWGSTEERSKTVVEVACDPYTQSREFSQNYGFDKYGPESYALFPAASQDNQHSLVMEGMQFSLSLRYKAEHETDVLCALWAWLNFGGLGARTRRGCGALYCKDFAPQSSAGFNAWLLEKMKQYDVKKSSLANLPVLSKKIFYKDGVPKALDAWGKEGLNVLKDFRQGKNFARNPGSGPRPGRSYWPEPDTLRRAFNENDPRHLPDINKPDGLPRALFGLPIIFQFIGSKGDPNSEAYPKDKKRMASPVILRPIGTQDNKFIAAALFLDGTCPQEIEIINSRNKRKVYLNYNSIVNAKFTTYQNSPMKGRSKSGDALEAFQNYLTSKGYKEVSL